MDFDNMAEKLPTGNISGDSSPVPPRTEVTPSFDPYRDDMLMGSSSPNLMDSKPSHSPDPLASALPGGGDDDLMRQFDAKASELSSFLQESQENLIPSSSPTNLDFLSADPAVALKSSTDSSPSGDHSQVLPTVEKPAMGDVMEELIDSATTAATALLGEEYSSYVTSAHESQPMESHGNLDFLEEPNLAVCKSEPMDPIDDDEIYTRRETITFDESVKKNNPEPPPPVPSHAPESDFFSQSTTGNDQGPMLHRTYDDQIEDDFERDSISQPLSHRLSDSLEVLKESPQKDFQMDSSLMDLEDLPSSSSTNNASPDLGMIGGGTSTFHRDPHQLLAGQQQQPIPADMINSGIFSQQPPLEDRGITDLEEDFGGFTSKPMASVPPMVINNATASMINDPLMTGSFMTSNNTLDNIQAPNFDDESEDSSSKNDVISSTPPPLPPKQSEKPKEEELFDFKPQEKPKIVESRPSDEIFEPVTPPIVPKRAPEVPKRKDEDLWGDAMAPEKAPKVEEPPKKSSPVQPPIPKREEKIASVPKKATPQFDSYVSGEVQLMLNVLYPGKNNLLFIWFFLCKREVNFSWMFVCDKKCNDSIHFIPLMRLSDANICSGIVLLPDRNILSCSRKQI